MDYEEKQREVAIKAMEVIYKMHRIAPVEISFGYTDKKGQCREGLVIKDAPPVVVTRMIEEGFSLSIEHGGVHVDKY